MVEKREEEETLEDEGIERERERERKRDSSRSFFHSSSLLIRGSFPRFLLR